MMSAAAGGGGGGPTASQRSLQRERERYEREQQIQLLTNNEPYSSSPSLTASNTLFDEPIKAQHKDETAKRIKDTLGEFEQLQSFIVTNHKTLLGVSTREISRMRDNRANKAKIEQILSEMKHNIQPITGLDDSDDAAGERSNILLNNSGSSNSSSNSSGPPLVGGLLSLNNNHNSHLKSNVSIPHSNIATNNHNSNHSYSSSTTNDHRKEPNRTYKFAELPSNSSYSQNHSGPISGDVNTNNKHSDEDDISLDEISDENENQFSSSSNRVRHGKQTGATKRPLLPNGSNSSPTDPTLNRIENLHRKKRRNSFTHSTETPDTRSVNHRPYDQSTSDQYSKSSQLPLSVTTESSKISRKDDSNSSDSDSSNSSSSSSSSSSEEDDERNKRNLPGNVKKKRRKALERSPSQRTLSVAPTDSKLSFAPIRSIKVESIGQRKAIPEYPGQSEAHSPEVPVASAVETSKPPQSWNLANFINKEKQSTPISTGAATTPVSQAKANNNGDLVNNSNSLINFKQSPPNDTVQNVIDAVARGECSQRSPLSDSDFSDSLSSSSTLTRPAVSLPLVPPAITLNSSPLSLPLTQSLNDRKRKSRDHSPSLSQSKQPIKSRDHSLDPISERSKENLIRLPSSLSVPKVLANKASPEEAKPLSHTSSPIVSFKDRTKAESKLASMEQIPSSTSAKEIKPYNDKDRMSTDVKIKSERKSEVFQPVTNVTNVTNVPKNLLVSINLSSLKRPPRFPKDEELHDPQLTSNNGTNDADSKTSLVKKKLLVADVKEMTERDSSRDSKRKERSPSDSRNLKSGSKKDKKDKRSKNDGLPETIENVVQSEQSARKEDKRKDKKKEKKDREKEKERSKEKDRGRQKDREQRHRDKDRDSSKDKSKKEKSSKKDSKEKKRDSGNYSTLSEPSKTSTNVSANVSSSAIASHNGPQPISSSSTSSKTWKVPKEEPSSSKRDFNPDQSSATKSITCAHTKNKDDQKSLSKPDFYLNEGMRLKHHADKENDRVRQGTKYLEAVIQFVQNARCVEIEHGRENPDKPFFFYKQTLSLVRHVTSMFAKSRLNDSSSLVERNLLVLSLRCHAVILFTMNRLKQKEIKHSELKILSQTDKVITSEQSTGQNIDPAQLILSGSRLQMPVQLYNLMRKQLDYLTQYNEAQGFWTQSDELIERDSGLNKFLHSLDIDCNALTLSCSPDTLIKYMRSSIRVMQDSTG